MSRIKAWTGSNKSKPCDTIQQGRLLQPQLRSACRRNSNEQTVLRHKVRKEKSNPHTRVGTLQRGARAPDSPRLGLLPFMQHVNSGSPLKQSSLCHEGGNPSHPTAGTYRASISSQKKGVHMVLNGNGVTEGHRVPSE